MTILVQVLAIWLAVPVFVYAMAALRVRRLRRYRIHDAILYAFCEARDTMAVKAAGGELDERSATFQYFYRTLSQIIHQHKQHPIGFGHIAKSLAENKNRPTPTWVLRLVRELKKSDEETRRVVVRYIEAIELVMQQDSLISILEAFPSWFRKRSGLSRSLATQRLLPRPQRSFLRFNLKLADVVGYTSEMCPAAV